MMRLTIWYEGLEKYRVDDSAISGMIKWESEVDMKLASNMINA